MGAGNKLDPTRFVITDLAKTSGCPLARVMRVELRKRGIHHLTVAYSNEPAAEPAPDVPDADAKGTAGRPAPGSLPYVVGAEGLLIAGEVVRRLTQSAGKTEAHT